MDELGRSNRAPLPHRREADEGQLAILASGRAGGVSGFYMYALTWVEFLVRQRGMGGMQEVLLKMGETGNVDAAFQAVHSRTYNEMLKYWKDDLRRRHGG